MPSQNLIDAPHHDRLKVDDEVAVGATRTCRETFTAKTNFTRRRSAGFHAYRALPARMGNAYLAAEQQPQGADGALQEQIVTSACVECMGA